MPARHARLVTILAATAVALTGCLEDRRGPAGRSDAVFIDRGALRSDRDDRDDRRDGRRRVLYDAEGRRDYRRDFERDDGDRRELCRLYPADNECIGRRF